MNWTAIAIIACITAVWSLWRKETAAELMRRVLFVAGFSILIHLFTH